MNSKKKGKRGELEVVRLFRRLGFKDVRRTAQYCGNTGEAADVIGLPGIHIEVKRTERLNIYEAMAQAIHDSAGSGNKPIVQFRKNDSPWLTIMLTEDWADLYREWEVGNEELGEAGNGVSAKREQTPCTG